MAELLARLLRHGKSKANEAGIIVSRPVRLHRFHVLARALLQAHFPAMGLIFSNLQENGIKDDYALAETGKEQADAAG